MCARFGIRQAFNQPYRHQANGKADLTGRFLKGFLRMIWLEEEINWVEALPRVLKAYHDLPGESGRSPFQILFGRERNFAGTPGPPDKECESAERFSTACDRAVHVRARAQRHGVSGVGGCSLRPGRANRDRTARLHGRRPASPRAGSS